MRRGAVAAVLTAALAGCGGAPEGGVATPTGTPGRTPGASPTAPAGPAATGVPSGAFLAPADLGPGWSTAPPATTPCAPSYARTAVRSSALRERRGLLTETVATGVDLVATVAGWKRALQGCGYAVRDEALGDASVSALSAGGADAVLVTGTEGVLVVLHARGQLARATDELDGWADLALGTSCVAAPDGCH